MWDLLSSLVSSQNRRVTLVIVGGGTLVTILFLAVLLYSVELSGLVAGAWLAILSFGLWALLDWSVKDIDTIRALQYQYVERDGTLYQEEPNVAWALVLAAFLIMLGLAMNAGMG